MARTITWVVGGILVAGAGTGVALGVHARAASSTYALSATVQYSQARTVNSGTPTADANSVIFTTTRNGQPLPNQTLKITVQRLGGTKTSTITTSSNGTAAVSLWTTHAQTMTVSATWVDPSGQSHTAQAAPAWKTSNGATSSPTPVPVTQQYTIRPMVAPLAATVGQSIRVGVTLVDSSFQGTTLTNQTGIPNQTVTVSGALGNFTLTTNSGGTATRSVPTTTPVSGPVNFSWTDPAGTAHSHAVVIQVIAATPTCAPRMIYTQWGASSLASLEVQPYWNYPLHIGNSTPGCAYALVAMNANGQGPVVVATQGVSNATEAVNQAQSIGWTNISSAQLLATGTVSADGSITLANAVPA